MFPQPLFTPVLTPFSSSSLAIPTLFSPNSPPTPFSFLFPQPLFTSVLTPFSSSSLAILTLFSPNFPPPSLSPSCFLSLCLPQFLLPSLPVLSQSPPSSLPIFPPPFLLLVSSAFVYLSSYSLLFQFSRNPHPLLSQFPPPPFLLLVSSAFVYPSSYSLLFQFSRNPHPLLSQFPPPPFLLLVSSAFVYPSSYSLLFQFSRNPHPLLSQFPPSLSPSCFLSLCLPQFLLPSLPVLSQSPPSSLPISPPPFLLLVSSAFVYLSSYSLLFQFSRNPHPLLSQFRPLPFSVLFPQPLFNSVLTPFSSSSLAIPTLFSPNSPLPFSFLFPQPLFTSVLTPFSSSSLAIPTLFSPNFPPPFLLLVSSAFVYPSSYSLLFQFSRNPHPLLSQFPPPFLLLVSSAFVYPSSYSLLFQFSRNPHPLLSQFRPLPFSFLFPQPLFTPVLTPFSSSSLAIPTLFSPNSPPSFLLLVSSAFVYTSSYSLLFQFSRNPHPLLSQFPPSLSPSCFLSLCLPQFLLPSLPVLSQSPPSSLPISPPLPFSFLFPQPLFTPVLTPFSSSSLAIPTLFSPNFPSPPFLRLVSSAFYPSSFSLLLQFSFRRFNVSDSLFPLFLVWFQLSSLSVSFLGFPPSHCPSLLFSPPPSLL